MPSGIYKHKSHSEETKRKISAALKGENNPNYGKHISKEVRLKISKYRKGKHHSKEVKRKIGKSNKGKIRSREARQKYSKANLGKHLSKETRRKMSEANRGSKSYLWKGGISFEPYSIDWTNDLREAIRKRDNYTCQLCGIHQDELGGWSKKLDIHHIDYQKDNLNPDNLITLCRDCHCKTNFNRNYWTEYFKRLQKGR